MSITVEATFENGILRPLQPLPFAEHQKVTITVRPTETVAADRYGLLGRQVDPEVLRQVAMDPDLEYE